MVTERLELLFLALAINVFRTEGLITEEEYKEGIKELKKEAEELKKEA